MMDPNAETLYRRMGGHDVMAALVDDLLARLTVDPMLRVYWKGKCHDSMKKDKQMILELLCMALGGPSHYVGRDMKTCHHGLGITEAEWAAFVQHTVATLDKLDIGEREKREFLAAADSLKCDIVESPEPRRM